MKKSPIIAAAIAATISGSTFAADTSMYGNIRLEVINQTELNMDSHKMIIGYKASEDMGNGMTGFMHIELENDNADEKGTKWDNDLSYVGVKGDFGSVSLGVQNDAAGFACSGTDIFTINGGNACGVGATNGELENSLVYVKGFGDVTVVLGTTLDGDKNSTHPAPGDHMVLAAQYAADAFSVGFQLTSPDSDLNIDDWMVVGGTYTINDIVIGLTLADNGTDGATAIAVSAPLAGGTVKVGFDTGDALDVAMGAAGDGTATNVEYVKNLSKSVYTGASFTSVDGVDDDQIALWLGMKF